MYRDIPYSAARKHGVAAHSASVWLLGCVKLQRPNTSARWWTSKPTKNSKMCGTSLACQIQNCHTLSILKRWPCFFAWLWKSHLQSQICSLPITLYSIEKGQVEEDCPFWKTRCSHSAAKSLILCYQTSIAEKACNPPTFNEISPATVAMFSSQSGLQIMQNAQAWRWQDKIWQKIKKILLLIQ